MAIANMIAVMNRDYCKRVDVEVYEPAIGNDHKKPVKGKK